MRTLQPPAPLLRTRCRRAHPTTAAARGTSLPDGSWTQADEGPLGGFLRAASAREPLQAGAPPLREAARTLSVEEVLSPRVQLLIEEMVAVCRARGIGLAAPQLGEPLRLVVLEDRDTDVSAAERAQMDRQPFSLKVLINPVLTPRLTAGTACFFEGCMSVQGFRGLVERALEVDCTALGGDGTPVKFTARGWLARVLQHECDHLEGTLYIDRMVSRAFRRVDLVNQPLPGESAEFGSCPPLGAQSRGFGSARAAPVVKKGKR